LFILLLNQEQQSFITKLYYDYRSLMYYTAYQIINNHHDAEDIINDTLLKLMKKTSVLMGLDCFKLRSYIVISIRHTAIDLIRKRGIKNELLFDDVSIVDDLVCDEYSADDVLDNIADSEQLQNALSQLKDRERDLLNMKYILNLSNEEIAKTYGLKPGSIASILSRARKKLRKIINEQEDK
jgi:RNA polymerase sigma-70 factor (ECF subfamily)